MATTSIIRRWVRGSLLIMVLVLVVAEAIFLYASYRDLYGGVQRVIESRFSTIAGRLQATGTAGDSSSTAESRGQALRRTVEQFEEKDKFEFMLLDAQGVILATSSGTMTRDLTDGSDFAQALTSASGVGSAIFTTPQGERVMAVTMLVPYAAGNIAAMRMVTSLTLVDRQWTQCLTASVGIGLLAFLLMLWSGLFFVRSIVRPLGEVEATATRIARGDLQARLPATRYNDEIGRLCQTINEMAEDLAENDRLKNEFISSVSHELRTPLTSIKGWVETIKNIDDPGSENYRRGLTVIGTETDRLYTMVEELLDFSRLQSGIKLQCQVLDLVAEATDAALFVEARIRQEGLQLVYEEPPEPYPVWADPARLLTRYGRTRPGCARCLSTCSTTPSSIRLPAGPSFSHSAVRRSPSLLWCGTRAGGSRRRTCKKSNRNFSKPKTRCGVPASAWQWWMRSWQPWAVLWRSPRC